MAFSFAGAGHENNDLTTDDEVAQTHGALVLGLLSSRIRRCDYFFDGWPGQTMKLLVGGEHEEQVIKLFKEDWDNFGTLKASAALGAQGRAMLACHAMQCVVNLQWATAFKATGWVPHASTRALAAERVSAVMSSIPSETLFNVMKNRRQERGRLKVSVPPRCMGVALASEVISKVHRFDVLPSDVMVGPRSTKLKPVAFGVGKLSESTSFAGVATTKVLPEYFSPTAANVSLPSADLHMIRMACADGLHLLERGIFGCFCQWSHYVVFKREVPGSHRDFGWHCALGHFAGSSCFAWPVHLEPVQGHEGFTQVIFSEAAAYAFLPIVSGDGIQAANFEFRSWQWQCKTLPRIASEWPPATRAFLRDEVCGLKALAAKSAWWSLDLAALKKLAEAFGVPLPPAEKLFGTVVHLTMGTLPCDERAAVDIAAGRVPHMVDEDAFTEEILSSDEAHEVLDRSDQSKLVVVQKGAMAARETTNDFLQEYKEARKKHPAIAKSKSRSKAQAKQTTNQLPANCEMMDQAMAKPFMPEGSALWKSRSDACWHGKVLGFGEVSRSVRAYGEDRALRLVLRECWRRHLDKHGLDVERCPIGGPFDGA